MTKFLRCLDNLIELNVVFSFYFFLASLLSYLSSSFFPILNKKLFHQQVNIQFTREKHLPNSAEREDIKKLLQCMLDMSWAGDHGDHSTVCDMCNMTSIWFKLAHMLLDTVFPEGGTLPEEEVLSNVAFGSLFRNNSSSKGISSRSLCKSEG